MIFLPTSLDEARLLGWSELDVILVSGDGYVDSPYIGVALIGKLLVSHGYRVGVIAQPISDDEIKWLGEPRLFWGVSGGSVDSMVANYTASKKRRKSDDYTPGGENTKRPDRAVIAYTNLIRKNFKNTTPIVLGGIEASLRRVSHYDFWDDKVRRSILFDAKADYLVYGMAERAVVELANAILDKKNTTTIRGVCYISKEPVDGYLELPSHDECAKDKEKFLDAFEIFYKNCDPLTAKGLYQKQDTRYLIQNPPAELLSEPEMDKVFALKFARDSHPVHKKEGHIKALDTIKFSVTTHYGCYGECSFCAIAVHQGRTIQNRSEESIIGEIKQICELEGFKGIISDVGGPTANMYGFECGKKMAHGVCEDKPCVGFKNCKSLKPTHRRQIELLRKIRELPKIKKAFVASGIRYDLIEDDKKYGDEYLREIVNHHVSGQLKIAPEHTSDKVLKLMSKPSKGALLRFKKRFDDLNRESGKKQFLTYYFIAAHPGCTQSDMEELKSFVSHELKTNPEQAQIFTPTPGTVASVMYYTGVEPFSRDVVFVEKDMGKKERQKETLTTKR